MTPDRSVAASVVALGFASTLTAPLPAFAAQVPCDRPEHYAAQAGAELLRINRLDLEPVTGPTARRPERAKTSASGDTARSASDLAGGNVPSGSADASGTTEAGAASRQAGNGARGDRGRGGGGRGGAAGKRAVGDVGLGDTRSVLIADGPVNSAGAARLLNGQVAGSTDRNDLVVQQAPPVGPKPNERRTGAKNFGPVRLGAGGLGAHAVWAAGMECGAVEGEAAGASAEISRVTISGGGSGALIRVPEKISSRSSTALRQRAGSPQTVASATISAGRISLVDNEVRIRVLRAPELRVGMTVGGKARVDYQPAVVEVSSRGGKQARLTTPGDRIEITLSEDLRPLESVPGGLEPIGQLPLPKVANLPPLGEPESTPAPAGKPGSTLRISLGKVRQATKGDAIAARATAIRVTVFRNDHKGRAMSGYAPSGLVADLGIGMLEAAAVAPSGTDSRPGGSTNGPGDSTNGPGTSANRPGASAAGSGTAVGAGPGDLPITGPGVVSLFIAGASLVIGGICAVVLTSRRRRNEF